METDYRTDLLTKLPGALEKCQRCPLHSDEGLAVPGLGHRDPDVLLLGEGPGEKESQTGRPFVGQAGQLLQEVLRELDIKMGQIWVTNVVKHRPPQNRNPTLQEMETCGRHFLTREIDLIYPKIIVALGRIPTHALLMLEGQEMFSDSVRGKTFFYKDYPVYSTWHPAYILRARHKKDELKNDLTEAFAHAARLERRSDAG